MNMKRVPYLFFAVAIVAITASCQNTEFKKTKSGMLYKIFPSNSKDSVAKAGNFVKLHYTQKLNDSVMQTTYGKMPYYIPVQLEGQEYNPTEILPMLKKGDSAITVVLTDTLFKKKLIPEGTPPFKKGQRITISFKVLEVFRDQEKYQADMQKEQEKDMPRQMKEREEQMAKMKKEMTEEKDKAEAEAIKSGDAAKQIKEVEAYLAAKNIKAEKTGKGTFVRVDNPGSGPAAEKGKYVLVKYKGSTLPTDSVFQESQYELRLGDDGVVRGWEEGLLLFKLGGKGKIFIPGFLAYGSNPPQGSGFKPNQPMAFEVEILSISDKPTSQQPQQ